MEIQKQKDLYLAKLLEQEVIKQDEFEDLVFKAEINAFHSNYLSSRFMDNINFGWSAWQAATAQAVPDGFVLVPKEPTDKTIAHMINTPIEVNLLCDHADTFLSEGEAYIAYKAMIEAQEPTND